MPGLVFVFSVYYLIPFLMGTLWTLFHAFKYWSWIGLLPVCLVLPYVAQRRQNTWPAIITHFIINSLSLVPVLGVVPAG